eukprot:gb/GECH01005433.1/.p1 GENE.gb/GECH01005433.1/~~gb/GECH01005433.1/.p1  ORF type:complete len:101 (+),score=5.24 gb/GECH01005433.1/:1-303(+)
MPPCIAPVSSLSIFDILSLLFLFLLFIRLVFGIGLVPPHHAEPLLLHPAPVLEYRVPEVLRDETDAEHDAGAAHGGDWGAWGGIVCETISEVYFKSWISK